MRHLSPAKLVDLAEGSASEAEYPHLGSCGRCREELRQVRNALALAAEVEVPEPSPLFWDHLSRRIHDRMAAEPTPVARPPLWRAWGLATAAGLAVVLIAVGLSQRSNVEPSREHEVSSEAAAGSAAPVERPEPAGAIAEDASFTFVAELAGDVDWESVVDAGLAARREAVDGAWSELSAEESAEVHRLLTTALAPSGA